MVFRCRSGLQRLIVGGILLAPPASTVASGSGAQEPDAGFLAAWQDQELRSIDLKNSEETEVYLALLPISTLSQDPLFSMVFRARFRSAAPATPPGAVEIRVQVNPIFDTTRLRSPVMRLVLNAGTDDRQQVDFVGRVPDTGVVLPGGRVDVVFFTVPVGTPLLDLINAETIDGQVFGVLDFVLTSAQIEALREFATRILSVS